MLDEANQFHPNIKLLRQLGTSVSFLVVYIENKNGILATSVYHKEAAEPFIAPFNSDHHRHIFQDVIDTALMRALRYSSTLSAFNEERRSIQLMLRYNRYPTRFIHHRLHKIFSSYLPTSNILPTLTWQSDFEYVRHILLSKPTIPEYQIASRIAKTINMDSEIEVDNPLVKARLNKRDKFDKNLINHYKYEKRFQSNKKNIHQLWNHLFQQTPVMDIRLIIGNRNSRNLTRELLHRRPPQS